MIDLKQNWLLPQKTLPIVIFGAGSIVGDAHLPAYKNSGFKVLGIYDPDLQKAKKLADQYGIKLFSTFDDTLKEKEVFGETSTILDIKRSVTAKAGPSGVTAIHVNAQNLSTLIKKNVALGAIIRKTQLRLIDSNNQSQELSNLMSEMLKKLEGNERNLKDLTKLVKEASSKLSAIASSNLD